MNPTFQKHCIGMQPSIDAHMCTFYLPSSSLKCKSKIPTFHSTFGQPKSLEDHISIAPQKYNNDPTLINLTSSHIFSKCL